MCIILYKRNWGFRSKKCVPEFLKRPLLVAEIASLISGYYCKQKGVEKSHCHWGWSWMGVVEAELESQPSYGVGVTFFYWRCIWNPSLLFEYMTFVRDHSIGCANWICVGAWYTLKLKASQSILWDFTPSSLKIRLHMPNGYNICLEYPLQVVYLSIYTLSLFCGECYCKHMKIELTKSKPLGGVILNTFK